MRDQSTAHVHRADVAARRASDWLKVAEANAPEGFDDARDGVLIHRAGTVLYACTAASRLLGMEKSGTVVGSALLDLFEPAERESVALILSHAGQAGAQGSVRASLHPTSRRGGALELVALFAREASPPVDVLYLCSEHGPGSSAGEDGREMERRDGNPLQGGPHRVTVLICDDEARLGALTAGLLSEFGFAPVTVGNGDEAIRALARTDLGVDVVLLDVNLSVGPSAGDVLRAMQSRGSQARVVLTSGLAEEDVSPDLLRHPLVVGYVAKPYGVDQLVQSVRAALSRVRS